MSETERAEWEARYLERGATMSEPSHFIVRSTVELRSLGAAVDLAGGTGRNAIWLGRQGWDVTLIDISSAALEIAADAAAAAGVALKTCCLDLDSALPFDGTFDLAIIHHYLNRSLLGRMAELLAPKGHVVMAHPTVINLERNDRPSRRYLLEPRELPSLLSTLEVASYFEGWTAQGRHEAQIVARQPPSNRSDL